MRFLLILLFCLPATAECPTSVACPYDGDQMMNTWNCKGVGDSRACEFSHTKTVYENGQPHQVHHVTWVSCGG
jgi:hypothetical protein